MIKCKCIFLDAMKTCCVFRANRLQLATFLTLGSSASFSKIFTNLKSGDSSRHKVPEMLGSASIMQVLQIFRLLCPGM
jgi:hypothetical protein